VFSSLQDQRVALIPTPVYTPSSVTHLNLAVPFALNRSSDSPAIYWWSCELPSWELQFHQSNFQSRNDVPNWNTLTFCTELYFCCQQTLQNCI